MLSLSILPLLSALIDASSDERRAGYDKASPAVKARTTRARTAIAEWCRANWPEYGRKVNDGWWAGPDHVQPERNPMIVASLSQGCGGYSVDGHSGNESSVSGCTPGPSLYRHMPIGGIVVDKRSDPYAVFGAPLLSLRSACRSADYKDEAAHMDPAGYPGLTLDAFAADIAAAAEDPSTLTAGEAADRAADRDTSPASWEAAHRAHVGPCGMSHVGVRLYLAYWLRHGASVGVRTARDTVTWIAGPRAGEVELYAPLPFYADEHQPAGMCAA